jgi:SAM-dependent methyltransferase
MKSKRAHSHAWMVGILGLVLGSVYSLAPERFGRLMERFRRQATDEKGYDFGWSWGAMNGPWLAAAAFLAMALGLELEMPGLWLIWFVVALFGVNCFVGGLILRTSKQVDFASLPLVDLIRSDEALVLDAGSGAGRTTLALSKVLRNGRIVALDRFDAYYIDGGGRALLERNLRIAGLTEDVQIQQGDLTELPFPDEHFDAAVSAHVIDHLKEHKQTGLAQIFRVLKPGGRFLMVVWVPGWVTFSLANVFCFLLTSKAGWRRLARAVGFTVADEGTFNGMWFAVLERPR